MKTIKDKEKTPKDYAKAMKEMGISKSAFPEYKNAEQHARTFRKTSIHKHTQVSFSASTV